MSITKNFEEKMVYMADTGIFNWEDVKGLLGHARALESMLKKHEFSTMNTEGLCLCPECKGYIVHGNGCELVNLLEGME